MTKKECAGTSWEENAARSQFIQDQSRCFIDVWLVCQTWSTKKKIVSSQWTSHNKPRKQTFTHTKILSENECLKRQTCERKQKHTNSIELWKTIAWGHWWAGHVRFSNRTEISSEISVRQTWLCVVVEVGRRKGERWEHNYAIWCKKEIHRKEESALLVGGFEQNLVKWLIQERWTTYELKFLFKKLKFLCRSPE